MISVTIFALFLSVCQGFRLPYIIGGKPAETGAWPWQGSLRRYGSHNCGCSLIANNWALTAAHCLGEASSMYSFQFGSNDRRSGGVIVKSVQIVLHPKYGEGEGSYPNDIALVKLDSTVAGENIEVIKMAAKGSEHGGNPDCWITGWGYTIPGPEAIFLPNMLQEVSIPVLTNDDCKEDWGDKITSTNVCVGDRNKRSSCNGDSGGPLVCKVNGEFELVGVTSWGIVFCWPVMPSVYTRVASYCDWISEVSGVST